MMSPMNTTNTSLQTIVLSDDTQIATYCQVGLSIVKLDQLFCDKKKIPDNSGLPDSTD